MNVDYADQYATLYRTHWWWRARERVLLDEIRSIVGPRPRPLRILDVGCGAGLFFDALAPLGEVEGIEADGSLVAAAGRWQSHITHGSLDDSFAPAHRFDLVLMLDVLEHLHDPVTPLQRALALMAPTGTLLVTVPALRWLWTRHDDLNEHVTRYSKRELTALLTETGWHVGKTEFLFASLVPGKLAVRALEAVTHPATASPQVLSPLVNRMAQRWLEIESSWRRVLPIGTSLLALARPGPA
jgi:2-polyprenyl-3-methyl-5-hydroxy-6-metoxy-1,4-benzoquinol methylase